MYYFLGTDAGTDAKSKSHGISGNAKDPHGLGRMLRTDNPRYGLCGDAKGYGCLLHSSSLGKSGFSYLTSLK